MFVYCDSWLNMKMGKELRLPSFLWRFTVTKICILSTAFLPAGTHKQHCLVTLCSCMLLFHSHAHVETLFCHHATINYYTTKVILWQLVRSTTAIPAARYGDRSTEVLQHTQLATVLSSHGTISSCPSSQLSAIAVTNTSMRVWQLSAYDESFVRLLKCASSMDLSFH